MTEGIWEMYIVQTYNANYTNRMSLLNKVELYTDLEQKTIGDRKEEVLQL